ncbi:MAG: BrnT family toxin [Candidatus Latescibacteria bacterium]|jgi:uncharacterized protein|nr:BrnT family toxin [Candidatus Latescibacterota bacterium]
MEFEWDESKNHINIERHRIDFRDAAEIFYDWHIILPSSQGFDEVRELAVGVFEGREVVVVHTWRGDYIRLVSARRARHYEREIYWTHVPK